MGTPSPRMETVFLQRLLISNTTCSWNTLSSLGQNSTRASAVPSGERSRDSNCTDRDGWFGWFVNRQLTLHKDIQNNLTAAADGKSQVVYMSVCHSVSSICFSRRSILFSTLNIPTHLTSLLSLLVMVRVVCLAGMSAR